jgi:hypothetical protein
MPEPSSDGLLRCKDNCTSNKESDCDESFRIHSGHRCSATQSNYSSTTLGNHQKCRPPSVSYSHVRYHVLHGRDCEAAPEAILPYCAGARRGGGAPGTAACGSGRRGEPVKLVRDLAELICHQVERGRVRALRVTTSARTVARCRALARPAASISRVWTWEPPVS